MLKATTDSNHTYLLAIIGHIRFWAIPYSSFSPIQTSMNQPLNRWKKLQLINTHKLQTITPLDTVDSRYIRKSVQGTGCVRLWQTRTSFGLWGHLGHHMPDLIITHMEVYLIHKGNQWFKVVWLLHISPCIPQQLTGSMPRAPLHNAAFLKGPKILDNVLARLRPC